MFNNKERDKMIKPQHMLVEERGLGNQIKRLKDLIPTESSKEYPLQYLKEQLITIVQDLEDIKTSIKYENDRILKHELELGIPQRAEDVTR